MNIATKELTSYTNAKNVARRYVGNVDMMTVHAWCVTKMNKIRGRKRIWMLLYKKEGEQRVWLYEPLRKYELNARKRQGWRVLKFG